MAISEKYKTELSSIEIFSNWKPGLPESSQEKDSYCVLGICRNLIETFSQPETTAKMLTKVLKDPEYKSAKEDLKHLLINLPDLIKDMLYCVSIGVADISFSNSADSHTKDSNDVHPSFTIAMELDDQKNPQKLILCLPEDIHASTLWDADERNMVISKLAAFSWLCSHFLENPAKMKIDGSKDGWRVLDNPLNLIDLSASTVLAFENFTSTDLWKNTTSTK